MQAGQAGMCLLQRPVRAAALALLLPYIFMASPAAGATTTGPGCATNLPPQNLPLPSCPASNKTLEDAKAVAWQLAPTLRFHPLEPYYLEASGAAAGKC